MPDLDGSIPGLVTFPSGKQPWIALLKLVYELESERVSGAASSQCDIRRVLWTIDELARTYRLDPSLNKELREMLEHLERQRQVMHIQATDQSKDRWITRVGETIRLLGHTYEYWYRGRPGIGAVRWLVEEKKVPSRSIEAPAFIQAVLAAIDNFPGEGRDRDNLRDAAQVVIQGVAKSISPRGWQRARFSKFQVESTIEFLRPQRNARYRTKAHILTAGVGSGKTLGFTIPALISAVEGIRGGDASRRCQLLVYPRKALALDQYRIIKRYVDAVDVEQLEIWLEHATSYPMGVKSGLRNKYGPPGPPPDLIITTFETLKRRLQHPLFLHKVSKHLSRVILDEIHMASGLPGANISMLVSRLSQVVPSPIHWTAASATVARPDEHAARIFGVNPSQVKVLLPDDRELETVGLIHHVFLRPSGLISNLGALVNSSSLLVHSRRDDLGDRSLPELRRPKAIAFADNLDILGRWNADLKENERTESVPDRKHPETDDTDQWKDRQRELPYALRFHRPLQRRIEAEGGKGDEGEKLEPVLVNQRGKSLCERCMQGERVSLGRANHATLLALSKIVFRSPNWPDDRAKAMWIRNPVFSEIDAEIGTLDLCPYLRAGACMWFPRGTVGIEPIPSTRYYDWKTVARSTIHSSKRETESVEMDEDLAGVVFKDSVRQIYDVGPDHEMLPVDIVLASPSLEVGVDLPMLTESIMTKAIRNVASYRQKAGRVGRELGLDVLNVTLITDTPVDLHYYRQPRKLVSLGRLEPIPLKDRNEAVVRSALYLAVWDWLSMRGILPEAIPDQIDSDGATEFARMLRKCRDAVEREKQELCRHLSGVSRGRFSESDPPVMTAIAQAATELDALLLKAASTLRSTPEYPEMTVADALVYKLAGQRGRGVRARLERNLEPFYEQVDRFKQTRGRVNSDAMGLAQEFRRLDQMVKCDGWDSRELETLINMVKRRLDELQPQPSREDLEELTLVVLPRILSRLRDLEAQGHNPSVFALYEQYKALIQQNPWKANYLSTIIQSLGIFDMLRKEPWFVRPENLFSNPYEPFVKVTGDVSPQPVPLGEALFGYVPGTWTYRLPQGCYKIRSGPLEVEPGGRLVATIDHMTQAGNSFERIRRGLPPPPGLASPIDVYMPTQVSLMRESSKYLHVNPGQGVILDDDEARGAVSREEVGKRRIKVPRSFFSNWVHVVAATSAPILPLSPDEGTVVVEDASGRQTGEEALKTLHHPLFETLLENASWHETLSVTEYTYGMSRSYSTAGNDGVGVSFRDRYGDIAIGRSFETEGLSIGLRLDVLSRVVRQVQGEIASGAPEWSSSTLKAFRAFLSSGTTAAGGGISPFLVNDVVSLTLEALGGERRGFHFDDLIQALKRLGTQPGELAQMARNHSRRKSANAVGDDETSGGQAAREDVSAEEERAQRLQESISELCRTLPEVGSFLESWIRRTLLNTFGIVALTAIQEYSGANDTDVGYAIDPSSWNGQGGRVFLYDRAAFGNGNAQVAARYMHVLHILRHGDTLASRLLPSEDFLSLLEEKLMQCPQFHADIDALSMLGPPVSGSSGLRGLKDVEEQAREIHSVSSRWWKELGVKGPQDAWWLPVAHAELDAIAERTTISLDDLKRATMICWNGCPECVDRPDAVAGGLLGSDYVDKALLDAWFISGTQTAEEYVVLDLAKLASGLVTAGLGSPNKVFLELPQRRVRSCWIPWTLGFQIPRGGAALPVQLILRASDVAGMRITSAAARGMGFGAGAIGFKRLLWFDLLTTAYMDLLGLLPSARKELELVYYDCRDIEFDDVGLSPRMTEAVLTEARRVGVSNLEKLSDILSWLAKRNFTITICVDRTRSEEWGVKELLTSLARIGGQNVAIYTKTIPRGSMHKKALVTPISVLQGSGNLTESAAARNEEIVDHCFYGTEGYAGLKANVDDTFQGSERWNPERTP